MKKNKSFFITAWNRNEILIDSIYSLTRADKYDEYNKFIIYQDCNNEQKDKIKKIDPEIKIIEKTYAQNIPVYQKMYLNLYEGFEQTFEKINSNFSIHLEDDIIVNKNLFTFYEYALNKYNNDTNFFAVNGMSKEFTDSNFDYSYSKFIWGICKCWGIYKNRWPTLKKIWQDYYSKDINLNNPYDGPIENYIKKNIKYVIMPYRSLILEQLSDGCNSVNNPNYPGFKEWYLSFNNENKPLNLNFSSKMPYSWRQDCIKYNFKNKLYLKIYYYLKKVIPSKIRKKLKSLSKHLF